MVRFTNGSIQLRKVDKDPENLSQDLFDALVNNLSPSTGSDPTEWGDIAPILGRLSGTNSFTLATDIKLPAQRLKSFRHRAIIFLKQRLFPDIFAIPCSAPRLRRWRLLAALMWLLLFLVLRLGIWRTLGL